MPPRVSARNRSSRSPACSAVAVMRIGPGGKGSLLAGMWKWDTPVWIRMGDGMRALKVAVIVMGVLIVVGTVALVIAVARRSPTPAGLPPTGSAPTGSVSSPVMTTAVLDEPEGTHIEGMEAVQDRLALRLRGGGADRVVVIDPRTGVVTGRISLAH